MPHMRIRDAAGYLGVSDDTVRRLIDHGSLPRPRRGRAQGHRRLRARAVRPGPGHSASDPPGVGSSARNRFVGLVTDIRIDTVMAQVELQCGPFRVVSLMSSEAVRDLASSSARSRWRSSSPPRSSSRRHEGESGSVSEAAAAVLLGHLGGGGAAVAGPGLRQTQPRTTTLTVYAASSLTSTFDESGRSSRPRTTASRSSFNFAGSSDLVAQIQQGAPADVFASADTATMDKQSPTTRSRVTRWPSRPTRWRSPCRRTTRPGSTSLAGPREGRRPQPGRLRARGALRGGDRRRSRSRPASRSSRSARSSR